MKYELPKGYLSASSLECLLKCPKQYEFRYIKGIKRPSNKALSLGSVVHESFANYYQDYLDTTERFTPKEIVELTMDDTLPNWFLNNDNDVLPQERNEIEHVVPGIVGGYVDSVGQFVEPLFVEREVRATMKCGVDILAYLDLVRTKDEKSGIVDYKITGKAWNTSKLVSSTQFMLYSYVTGMRDVQIHNVVAPKPGKQVSMDRSYSEQDRRSVGTYDFSAGPSMHVIGNTFENSGDFLEDMVRSSAELVTAGIFPPCLPSSWWCTPAWCDYWKLCRGKAS